MIKNVKVIPGCISCRNCETVCPKVFKVNPKSEVISNDYEGKEIEILQAELMCPVQVIKVEKQGSFNLSLKTAKLKDKKYLTSDTLELNFSTDNFSFKPGQYISVQMKDWKGVFFRSYSIAKADKNSFSLTVKLLDKGRGAKFLKKLKTGKKLNYLGALGNFYLKDTKKEKVFIATGTGLAPMIAMLENTDKDIKKTVIFGVRYENDIFYKELLESYPNTKVIIKVSRPGENYRGDKGRVTDSIEDITIGSEIYICGNPEMIDSVKKELKKQGHSQSLIYNESFTIQRNYPGLVKDIFINGNIPAINLFSRFVISISLIGIPLFYNYVDTNTLWDISWWAVVFVMGIRPLADLFPKLAILSKLVTLRKAFGILSSSIVVTALIYKYAGNTSFISDYFSQDNFSLYYPILARASEITGLILLITSNNFSQKKLGVCWKKIQRLSYIYFISGGLVAAIYSPMKIYPAMIIIIILWILAQIKITLKQKKY